MAKFVSIYPDREFVQQAVAQIIVLWDKVQDADKELMTMMHAFMQLNDGTEIVHSDVLYDEAGNEYVKVYMEKPIMQGFKSAYCILPKYEWKNIDGFDELELAQLKDIIKNTSWR